MQIQSLFKALKSDVEFFSLRYVDESSETVGVRQGIALPFKRSHENGAMLTVIHGGGMGYAATSDLSQHGLQTALDHARHWAAQTAKHAIVAFEAPRHTIPGGEFAAVLGTPLPQYRELLELLYAEDRAAQIDARIVDSIVSLDLRDAEHHFLTNQGGDVKQRYRFVLPNIQVTASDGRQTQVRSLAGQYNGYCQQGGFDVIVRSGLIGGGVRVARDAIALLEAENCPSGSMDLLLMPDQMMLQIHESIGHPLELDRILGDERNFAGTSFVKLDMFGSYRYGSELLNVTFDPTHRQQYASYAYDDDGVPATRQHLIQNGVLQRALGGSFSQRRAREIGVVVEGVANTRASNWNRPPIDRMANINVEPGDATLDEMIASVERGVLMRTNVSWSIDDSRNKFQFGCEFGQMIENGKLTRIVKNPNYRGISANFWRSLRMVGDAGTFEVMGTPFCGKGEPSQTIRVGHASPPCLFSQVDVFGGAQ